MNNSVYYIARDSIKLSKKTLNTLSRLLVEEGFYVDVPGPPPTTCREWVESMIPWWEEKKGGPYIEDVWDERRATMSDEDCRKHAIAYHKKILSHGEVIGVTIQAWSLWVGTPQEAAIRKVLSAHIATALKEGVDH